MKSEKGFTIIELAVVMAISAVLLTLGAAAVRHFWFVQSLDGAADEVKTQLRQVQQRTMSESHPLVYGVRFRKGTSEWAIVRYDPQANSGAGSCTQTTKYEFGTGAFSAEVRIEPTGTSFSTSPTTDFCSTNLVDSAGNTVPVTTSDVFAFFYARGSATAGKVTLEQPTIARTRLIEIAVGGITGRVTSAYKSPAPSPSPTSGEGDGDG